MARASTKSTVKSVPAPEKTDAAPVRDNPGRELLELRIRWKIVNETVEAGIVERKRLREAIDALVKEIQHSKGETE
jgi:hypothetical protein